MPCLKRLHWLANKRVANILAKRNRAEGSVIEANLVEDAEKHVSLNYQKSHLWLSHYWQQKTTPLHSQLAALRAPINAFFDSVMVMADDAELKAYRLRFSLAQLRDLFTRVSICKCVAALKS